MLKLIFSLIAYLGQNLHKLTRKLKKVEIANSKNYRDFINIKDLSNLFLKCLKVRESGTFEVGTGKATSIKHLAILIKKILKKDINLIFTKPLSSKQNFYSKGEIKITKKIFSWEPKINLKKGVKSLIIFKR